MPERTLWDNANIAESYSGVTTPLTISFAKRVYRDVYRGMAHASGLSWSTIARHDDIFSNLVDCRYGRLYYNLLNWYRFAALFPGFRRNTRNLERMLTVPHLHDLRRELQPSTWFRLRYPAILLWRILTMRSDIHRFQKKVKTILQQLLVTDNSEARAERTWNTFQKLSNAVLPMWHIATDNDFLVMSYTGALTSLLSNKNEESAVQASVQYLTHQSTLPSQFVALQKLRTAILADAQASTLLSEKHDAQLWAYLSAKNRTPALMAFANYHLHFGARLPNELKLETPSLQEQPHQLFDLLRAYADFSLPPAPLSLNYPAGMGRMRRMLAYWYTRRAAAHLAYREQTRLLRAEVFGAVRTLLLTVGACLQKEGIFADQHEIFWLTLDEVPAVIEGVIERAEVQRRIQERRQQFALDEKCQAPNRFWEENGNVVSIEDVAENSPPGEWKGLGASRGKVRGRVLLLAYPDASAVRPGDILVAQHTDPGWTPVFGLVAGVIVEYGGLLSHASIVAREYQIPCVVQIPGITSSLKTGQHVLLDGTAGVVRLV